ncbi:acyl-CoA dehydrogenase family protein [Mycolicibacterium sp.]|uniref:acyl-CoA dehydrogenase family protein n=1 Tax=Mycolicibacterium sp. TaxID=2320850 RepID=UPI003D1475D1
MTMLSVDIRAALGDSVRAACARLAQEERIRAVAYDRTGADRGFDRELWLALCEQIGVAAVAVPEDLGGAGFGPAAQAVIAHELGRVLGPVPFLSSAVLATGLLVRTGAPEGLLAGLLDGRRTAALLVDSGMSHGDCLATGIVAEPSGRGWTLHGSVRHVLHGASADHLVVVADVDAQQAVFIADRAQSGVAATEESVLDGTRPMATVTLRGAHADRLAPEQPVRELLTAALRHTAAVLTAEQVGAAERALEMATEYARTRRQFDRAIGSFQAVKHRCADMLVDLEMARSASLAAVQAVNDEEPDADWRVNMAAAVCSEALRAIAHGNLQVHGGIGFTWEHAAGLYVRRARTDEVLFGSPGRHWDDLAAGADIFGDRRADGGTAR